MWQYLIGHGVKENNEYFEMFTKFPLKKVNLFFSLRINVLDIIFKIKWDQQGKKQTVSLNTYYIRKCHIIFWTNQTQNGAT